MVEKWCKLVGGRECLGGWRLKDSGGYRLAGGRENLQLYDSGGWGLTGRRGSLRLYEWWVGTDGKKREP